MPLLLTFPSIHEALRAERAARGLTRATPCASGDSPPGLIPLPPRVKSDCGFGLLISYPAVAAKAAVQGLREAGITISGVYARKEKLYERVD